MTLPQIQEQAQLLMQTGDTREAYRLAKKLELSIIDNQVELNNKKAFIILTKITFSLYLFSIEFVSDDILQKMIRYNVREMVSFEVDSSWDLIYHLEQKFLIYPVEIAKEKLQEICLPSLEDSRQYLGNAKLNISMENPNQEPTISNWLKYYDRKTALGKSSNFTRSKFFSSDDAMITLSSKEKSDLRAIIAFYDYLRNDKLVTFEEESDTPKKPTVIKTQPAKVAPQKARTVAPPQNIQMPQPVAPQKSQSPIAMKKSQTIDLKKMMEDKRS